MSKQFIAVDVSIYHDLERGTLTPNEFFVLTLLLQQVNYCTGIWTGSVPKLQAGCNSGISKAGLTRALSGLCKKGYLKSWYKKNKKGNYAVALDRYEIRTGPKQGYRLNAHKTTEWENPVYEQSGVVSFEDVIPETGSRPRVRPEYENPYETEEIIEKHLV